jgi:hypothetical protein
VEPDPPNELPPPLLPPPPDEEELDVESSGRTIITVHAAPHALHVKRSSADPDDDVVAGTMVFRFADAARR